MMGHRHAMATAKVMRTAAFTGCATPRGDVRNRARTRPTMPRRHCARHLLTSTTVTGRSPWMNDRVGVLLRFLADDHGIHLRPELARVQVAGHIDLLVSVLRLNRQTARQHVTDEVLRDLACDIAATVALE